MISFFIFTLLIIVFGYLSARTINGFYINEVLSIKAMQDAEENKDYIWIAPLVKEIYKPINMDIWTAKQWEIKLRNLREISFYHHYGQEIEELKNASDREKIE